MDNEDIVINLDYPCNGEGVEGLKHNSQVFWNKFSDSIDKVRKNCADTELFHGIRRTKKNADPNRPLFNVIFEITDDGLMEVTFKCQKSNFYMIAVRKGRGDPQPGPESTNTGLWRECNEKGCNFIQGAIKLDFSTSYMETENGDLGIGNKLGFQTLRKAITGIWHGKDMRKNFLTICVHISETARFECFMAYLRKRLIDNLYAEVEFRQIYRTLVKEWSNISKVIQNHLELNEPFEMKVEELKELTFEQAKKAMGVISYYEVVKPKENQ